MIPIEIKAVDCKKCDFNYCPCCETKCPQCGEVDVSDNPEIMLILQKMREGSITETSE
jgi:hypothetical protein